MMITLTADQGERERSTVDVWTKDCCDMKLADRRGGVFWCAEGDDYLS